MKHLNIHVYGSVQGVFYRHNAKEKANLLGVTGFTRNEDDGSVYTEAEGEDTPISEFVEWSKKGPQLANVERAEVTEGPLQHFPDFSLK